MLLTVKVLLMYLDLYLEEQSIKIKQEWCDLKKVKRRLDPFGCLADI